MYCYRYIVIKTVLNNNVRTFLCQVVIWPVIVRWVMLFYCDSENYLFVCQCEKCTSQADDPDVTSEEEIDDDDNDDTGSDDMDC